MSTKPKKPKRLALQRAIHQLQGRGEPVSFTAVAQLVGVTPSLIHNTYPDIADEIREINGASPEAQRDEARKEVASLRKSNEILRTERDSALDDNRKLASMNESLRFELARLRGLIDGTVKTINVPGSGRKR